ncbi:MAG: hypothetical protein N2515_06250 [Deltaproteobacteria bacterium]|nr:hypothetical protein [Deltaproteobacteria bacterium]
MSEATPQGSQESVQNIEQKQEIDLAANQEKEVSSSFSRMEAEEGHAEAEHGSEIAQELPDGSIEADEVQEERPERGSDPRPYLILTAVVDAGARASAVTLSHADAWERAMRAVGQRSIAGMDLVEVRIPANAFNALRNVLKRSPTAVAVYDLFPLAAHLGRRERKVAGQFLAAEGLWALAEEKLIEEVHIRFDTPRSWGDRTPKTVRTRLLELGALELSEQAVEDFRAIKAAWDAEQGILK